MAGYDNADGAAGLVAGLIDKAVASLDEMSDTAGEIAPDVGGLTDTLVAAQRIADRAAQELKRLSAKVKADAKAAA